MSDVIHDPRTDWCACEPDGYDRCGYRMLADKAIEQLNPPDGDAAEVSLCMDAIDRAAAYIKAQPCYCVAGYDDAPCGRCAALGEWHGEPQ
jgi:hypothetical protein